MAERTTGSSDMQPSEGTEITPGSSVGAGEADTQSTSSTTLPRKEYQEAAVKKGAYLKKCPVLAPRGSGKTRIALDIVREIYGDIRYFSFTCIIITPRTSLAHWKNEIKKWTGVNDEFIAVVRGTPQERHFYWNRRKRYKFLLVTYGSALQDKKFISDPVRWDAVITDESHKFRNRNSKTFKLIKAMRYEAGLFLTGSIFRSQVLDVWTTLHLSNKKVFSSFWKFANTYVHVFDGFYGKEFGGPKNMENFRGMLRKRSVYIRPDEVGEELPALNRQYLDVEMWPKQRKLYDAIWEDLIVDLESGDMLIQQNEMVQSIRARQCLCCPAMLDESIEVGAGFEAIVEHGEQDPHYIVFCPFTKALPWFKNYLVSQGYDEENIFTIQGGMDPTEQGRVTDKCSRQRGILLCSIGIAESWEITTCNQVYFMGYDWSPDVNEQAEDRVRRVSSDFSWTNAHYVRHAGTYDEDVLEAIWVKRQNVRPALYSPEEMKKVLNKND